MGEKPPGLKADNNISRTHVSSSPRFHRKQVANP
jgi:hypothetical protein